MDSSRFVRIFAFWAAALQRAAVLSGAAALCCAATAAQPDQAPWEELRGDLTRLNAALADSSPPALDGLLDEWAGRRADHEGFTRTVFRDYCARTLKGYGKFMSGKELDDFVALPRRAPAEGVPRALGFRPRRLPAGGAVDLPSAWWRSTTAATRPRWRSQPKPGQGGSRGL